MATNGLLIEFGATGRMDQDSLKALQQILSTLGGWKSEGVIEEFRFYPIVTGNRSQRVAMLMLEMSHEQLEALVVNPAYGRLMESLGPVATNITVNRAITVERMMELAKDFVAK